MEHVYFWALNGLVPILLWSRSSWVMLTYLKPDCSISSRISSCFFFILLCILSLELQGLIVIVVCTFSLFGTFILCFFCPHTFLWSNCSKQIHWMNFDFSDFLVSGSRMYFLDWTQAPGLTSVQFSPQRHFPWFFSPLLFKVLHLPLPNTSL